MNRNKLIKELQNREYEDVVIYDSYGNEYYSTLSIGRYVDEDKTKVLIVINDREVKHVCANMCREDPLDLIKIYKTSIKNDWYFEKDYTDGDISVSIKHCPFCGEKLV